MSVTPLELPPTTDTYGKLSVTVLSTPPADPAAVTQTEADAGVNFSCHLVGDWYPTAETEGVARQRKACQVNVTQAKGTTTWELGQLIYTYMPQLVGTPGGEGNEAYEALPENADVWLIARVGVDGKTPLATGDAYRAYPAVMAAQVPGPSADDAGAEAVITQSAFFQPGYEAPIDGVIAAGV